MIDNVRHSRLMGLVLALSAASCTRQSPPEAPAPEAPAPAAAGASNTPAEDPNPQQSNCDCGPMLPPAPSDCPRERWFCNREGKCDCEAAASPNDVTTLQRPAGPAGSGGAPGAGGGPGCMCTGASVSPPQGGCPLSNWFCNASGLCRCRL